jgi:hypothetical protein
MLRALHMKGVGPAAQFDLELGERLNVLTGDNGLGKSFMLEVAWWALTGSWVERPVLPKPGQEDSASIVARRGPTDGEPIGDYALDSHFDRITQEWDPRARRLDDRLSSSSGRSFVPALDEFYWDVLVLYVRPDGLFSLFDPVRFQGPARNLRGPHDNDLRRHRAYHFTPSELWNGLKDDDKTLCNGLIQDWVTWQLEDEGHEGHPFQLLARVLARLSHPEEKMVPGKPVRLYLDDVRKFPTVELPHETIPIVHASAGMKRILSLAYLIAWMWTEHTEASRIIGRSPADSVVVLLDEPETHLHPKWQRHIAPALLDVLCGLSNKMRPQVLMTTHAPLVLASLEPHFNTETDRLYSFELRNREVVLEEIPWAKHGDALAWLTSDVFDLKEGRSIEGDTHGGSPEAQWIDRASLQASVLRAL